MYCKKLRDCSTSNIHIKENPFSANVVIKPHFIVCYLSWATNVNDYFRLLTHDQSWFNFMTFNLCHTGTIILFFIWSLLLLYLFMVIPYRGRHSVSSASISPPDPPSHPLPPPLSHQQSLSPLLWHHNFLSGVFLVSSLPGKTSSVASFYHHLSSTRLQNHLTTLPLWLHLQTAPP